MEPTPVTKIRKTIFLKPQEGGHEVQIVRKIFKSAGKPAIRLTDDLFKIGDRVGLFRVGEDILLRKVD